VSMSVIETIKAGERYEKHR